MKDFYKVLGVDEKTSQDEIKKVYRKLSLKMHPDKGGDPEKFKEISEAYQVLGDEERRKQYDMEKQFGGGVRGFGGGGTPEEIFHSMFGGGGNGMGGFPFNFSMNGMNMGGNMPNNVRIFRNGVEVTQNTMNKPVPIVKTIEITLEQAFSGYKYPLEIERWIQEEPNMKRTETETVYIDIPCGIDNNEIIILREKGNILSDTNKGDIKLFVKIKNTTEFIRKGLELIYTKKISFCESLCGFKFNIECLDGKHITISNTDRVIHPGYQKAIPGMGMRRDNSRGSMIIQFEILYPTSLTERQKQLLKEAFVE